MSAGREDLMLVVRQAFESAVGFRGSFFGVSLVDLAQMCNLARRTLSIELSGPMTGALHFVRGELVHAELVSSGPSRDQSGAPHAAILRGEEALPCLFGWTTGRMNMTVLATTERTLSRPFQALLLDALTALDDAHPEVRPGTPDRDLESAAPRDAGRRW